MRYNAFINSNTELQQYCCKVLALTKTKSNHLEMAHHQWLKRILHVSWKDMVSNEDVRKRCQQNTCSYVCQPSSSSTLALRHKRDQTGKESVELGTGKEWRHGRPITTWKYTMMRDVQYGHAREDNGRQL